MPADESGAANVIGGKRIPISWLLALIVVASIVPLLALSGTLLARVAEAETERYEQQALQIAQRTMLAIDRDIASIEFALEALAGLSDETGGASLNRQIRRIERTTGTRIEVAATEGGARRRLSALMPGRDGWSLEMSVPLDRKAERQLVARMSPERLGETLLSRGAPGWTISLVDPQGRIVWRSKDPQLHVGRLATQDLRDNATGTEGVWRGSNLEGERVLAAYARSELSGLRVAVGAPEKLATGPVHASLRMLAGFGLIALLASLLLAFWSARLISRPLRHLSFAGSRLGQAAARIEVVSRVREISDLTAILNKASGSLAARSEALAQSRAKLEELNQSLEAAVEARTSELSAALIRLREEEAERRSAEDALRQAQKMEALGQLTGGVAHDFNNLLTIIRSSLELLRRPDVDQRRRERYLDAIDQASGRGAALTSQLLSFARRQPMQRRVFDLKARIEGMMDLLKTTLGENISLSFAASIDHACVETDPNQFESAVLNLVVNARDAMGGSGSVALILAEGAPDEAGARYVAVSVVDTGHGIDGEIAERIFEPFYTTKDPGKGTGLGLSQVYGFARQSGGRLEVQSEVGRGATFTLFLPLSGNAAEAAAEEASVQLPAGKSTILVVEDNELVAELAGELLGELGYETRTAPNAAAALALLEEASASYDAVLSDVVMPGGMSGIELAERLEKERPELPVILATGYSQVLAESGRSRFTVINKPYNLETLANVLSNHVRVRAVDNPS